MLFRYFLSLALFMTFSIFLEESSSYNQACVFLLSHHPDALQNSLNSLQQHLMPSLKTFVFCFSFSQEQLNDYQNRFPNISFIESDSLKPLKDLSLNLSCPYIFFLTDHFVLTRDLSLDYLLDYMHSPNKIAFVLGHYPHTYDAQFVTSDIIKIRAKEFVSFPRLSTNEACLLLRKKLLDDIFSSLESGESFLPFYFSKARHKEFVLLFNEKKAHPKHVFEILKWCDN